MSVVNVCTCFDEHLELAAMVLIQSLIDAHVNTDIHLNIFALHTGELKYENVFRGSTPNINVVFHEVVNAYAALPGHTGAYLRFMMAETLPPEVRKVLYLDADIVVQSPLAELVETDLGVHSFAAMPDYPTLLGSPFWLNYFFYFNNRKYRPLSFIDDVLELRGVPDAYINTGVMLIDLDRWQEIRYKAVDFLAMNPKLPFQDQDAISYAAKGRFVILSPCYNSISSCARKDLKTLLQKLSGVGRRWGTICETWQTAPKIIHYAGPNKPWKRDRTRTALDPLWWHYAAKMPFYDEIRHLN